MTAHFTLDNVVGFFIGFPALLLEATCVGLFGFFFWGGCGVEGGLQKGQ